MLQANHYDMDMIRDCAEKVASHWQQLMLKMEDRLKLVNASVAFYKTSEQVGALPTNPPAQLPRATRPLPGQAFPDQSSPSIAEKSSPIDLALFSLIRIIIP